jgi:Fic family protein
MPEYKWRPIEDLPDSWRDLASGELKSLAGVWLDQQKRLHESEALKIFNEKLQREWAIETGVLEKLYTIDRGITQLLIENGINAALIPHGTTDRPPEQVVAIIKDQADALEGIFAFVKGNRDLSTSYIKELHQVFTRHQDTVEALNGGGRTVHPILKKGEYKPWPNNPLRPDGEVHEYCPPEQVASEMERLVKLHHEHCEMHVPPELEAAWLHHRFTQIHPFMDGNGRVARALASLVFLRNSWFPLVVNRDNRDEYIRSLEQADAGSLKNIVTLFVNLQKKAFVQALSVSEEILRGREDPISAVIDAAHERLKTRAAKRRRQYEKVFSISQELENSVNNRLQQVADELQPKLAQVQQDYRVAVDKSWSGTEYWFKKQIVDIARNCKYFADTRTYAVWVRLKIIEQRQTELVFSFHSLGVTFSGVMAVSSFIDFRDKSENDEPSVDGPYATCKETFQFVYSEDPSEVKKRFGDWLEDAILSGLDRWRKQL